MNALALTNRNKTEGETLYPPFRDKVFAVLSDMTAHGYRPRIQQGYRSPAEQLVAYNTGHSKLKFGYHNVTLSGGDPSGLAVDVLDDDAPMNTRTKFFLMLASAARAHGLETGILWGLTERQRKIVNTAIAAKDWDAPVRIGWDAGHIQIPGYTPLSAQKAIRDGTFNL